MSKGGFGSERAHTRAPPWRAHGICSFMLWTRGESDLGERVRVLHERLAARLRGPVMGRVGEGEPNVLSGVEAGPFAD